MSFEESGGNDVIATLTPSALIQELDELIFNTTVLVDDRRIAISQREVRGYDINREVEEVALQAIDEARAEVTKAKQALVGNPNDAALLRSAREAAAKLKGAVATLVMSLPPVGRWEKTEIFVLGTFLSKVDEAVDISTLLLNEHRVQAEREERAALQNNKSGELEKARERRILLDEVDSRLPKVKSLLEDIKTKRQRGEDVREEIRNIATPFQDLREALEKAENKFGPFRGS